MAMNVFGNPITISTVQGMVEYQKKERKDITQLDKAKVALNMKNARGNDFNVFKFVESVGVEMQEAPVITLCVIYNATGDNLHFHSFKDWKEGQIANTPFPQTIANGQWAGFVHLNPWGESKSLPSRAAVVYRGKNAKGHICDFMFAWDNPWKREDDAHNKVHNKAFTEIRERDHYEKPGIWAVVDDLLGKEGRLVHRCRPTSNGCLSSVSIGDVRKGAFVEAIFTLDEHADDNNAPK